ncbi:triphosphoribosyl-dephospho-CoA synthase [Methylobacterium frigidaeris]|uniref:2-(5''-triphosphoribosyl)-3'-dephosphocoenzyme-A synthase n=1 Tax=Methylobacterium frigidaeris TaxID=2038277 RepID=A0AA37M386_9HYPH|nr:triphosphoribosyl-dephospho-CoA synthase [Methylobacterium frigidaeris]PIK69539.1 triphosphoribosyl-dephospho-CoA synthase [Methylobacterium frigidaeris]GJD60596.1 2-(5''-triphosphoribosyl)-3'-dephosphocoenzyme-A synthase [Methylobacterium frigidaeris]
MGRESALRPEAIAEAYLAACRAELAAIKPGNVHVHAAGHRMSVADFEASAALSAPPLAAAGARVGARIEGAVAATRAGVGQNTNLGIVLLCAPLAAAAEQPGPLRAGLAAVLAGLDDADAAGLYAAIRLASPGGLGRAERHDVTAGGPPPPFLAAMGEAAARDRIARAYVTGFEDLFATGLAALAAARAAGLPEPWTTTAVHLAFLIGFPDSHIARKFGPVVAERVRAEAEAALGGLILGEGARAALLAHDSALKKAGLNPGTSADLTVATLFLDALGRLKG